MHSGQLFFHRFGSRFPRRRARLQFFHQMLCQYQRRRRISMFSLRAQRVPFLFHRSTRRTAQRCNPLSHRTVQRSTVLCTPPCFGPQLFLQGLIAAGAKQIAENLASLLGFCMQKLQKGSLGNHGHLGELTAVQPGQRHNSPRYLPGLGHRRPAVWKDKRSVSAFKHHTLAPHLGPLILRIAPDSILFSAVQEFQFHISGRTGGGIFAAQHIGFPRRAAGLTVQSKSDGVKQGCFTGAGIAGDEI